MRTIALTYPGFHALPSGVKRLLVLSESFFFEEEGGRPGIAREPQRNCAAKACANQAVAHPFRTRNGSTNDAAPRG